MTNYETAHVFADEVRFAVDDSGVFAGYAAVWERPDSFGDVLRKGAFAKSLKKIQPAMLWQHDQRTPIGRWTSLAEDERGLRVEGKLVTGVVKGAEALELLKAKALNGMSIGFVTARAERGPNGGRIVTEVQLFEISLVTFPSADMARVDSVKSARPGDIAAFVQAARRAATVLRGTK